MYRIRAVCQNPKCQAVFGIEFTETGPLEAKTPELAFELCSELHRTTSYKGVNIPKFVKCPKCHSIFPTDSLRFFVYDAAATKAPTLSVYSIEL